MFLQIFFSLPWKFPLFMNVFSGGSNVISAKLGNIRSVLFLTEGIASRISLPKLLPGGIRKWTQHEPLTTECSYWSTWLIRNFVELPYWAMITWASQTREREERARILETSVDEVNFYHWNAACLSRNSFMSAHRLWASFSVDTIYVPAFKRNHSKKYTVLVWNY